MSLPTTWVALPNVDTARNQGSDPAACADSKVRGLLRRGQPQQRSVRTHDVHRLQRRDLSELPQATAPSSPLRPSHGDRTRQCPLPSRCTPGPVFAPLRSTPQAPVSAALQPPTRTHRASLQVSPATRNAQSLLRYTPRGLGGRRRLLRPLATAQSSAATTMLHYLRRCV